jgi:hypothetical protein
LLSDINSAVFAGVFSKLQSVVTPHLQVWIGKLAVGKKYPDWRADKAKFFKNNYGFTLVVSAFSWYHLGGSIPGLADCNPSHIAV